MKLLAIELSDSIYDRFSLIAKSINRSKKDIAREEIQNFIKNFESELQALGFIKSAF